MTIEEAKSELKDVPGLTSRAMFGGHGLYSEGRIFAVLIDGDIYLKADKEVVDEYQEAGGQPFTYISHNGPASMNYYRFPTPAALNEYLQTALDVAARAPFPKKRK